MNETMICPICGKGDPDDPDPTWPGCPVCTPGLEVQDPEDLPGGERYERTWAGLVW